MPRPLTDALAELRDHIRDPERLVRAVAAGRRRGESPRWSRAELRPVTLKGTRKLQVVVTSDRPHTRNVDFADPVVAELLAEPFGNWHVETLTETIQLRVTKKGEAQVSRQPAEHRAVTEHDRRKAHLLPPGDPVYGVIGGSAAKRRQVDAFLRALDATLGEYRPRRIVDLGCGNAYLTFAAYRYLQGRGIEAELIGVDVRADQRDRNTALAAELGWSDRVRFVAGTILDAPVDSADVVVALHACDTATDEALARAVGWGAEHILAAPCCHHDIAAQLRSAVSGPPGPAEGGTPTAGPGAADTAGGAPAAGPAGAYGSSSGGIAPPGPGRRARSSPLIGQPILRERFADVLTDTLRSLVLRQHGYRVEVTEFVDSAHTPRNLLLRAKRTGKPSGADEYRELIEEWRVRPHLATLLAGSDVTPRG